MRPPSNTDRELLTPADMRNWLIQEMRDVLKAQELRVKDATEFVTAYCLGEIDSKEAARRFDLYTDRWGDAIMGVSTDEGMTNAEIVGKRDQEIADGIKRSRAASLRDGGGRGRA